ncbi:glycosyltransferase [Chromobacterium sphagni]|uniref:glycosyltransferase n=1 Tax=Chromobacterium sphagni TaxID=1903179 RepID=UPI0009F1D08C|nr:glycosyltransferase [Chromobacterium sphagni]
MAVAPSRKLVIHAPNVHQGGGMVLLKALLASGSLLLERGFFDIRAKQFFQTISRGQFYYVRPSLFSRLITEIRLWWLVKPGDVVLCFHGLPPILPLAGRVVVFVQNRILVESDSLDGYPFKTKIRLILERFWLRATSSHAQRYIVQTCSMAASLKSKLGRGVEVYITPFASLCNSSCSDTAEPVKIEFDFSYVASGDPHKNHIRLIEAWKLLAEAGIKPSLALTVDPVRYPSIHSFISQAIARYSLRIVNFGELPQPSIVNLYRASSALIYPSTIESFGLPLLEAAHCGLPILAAELDYVRDVVEPVETFDPCSPVSIARAVRRFIESPEPTADIYSPDDFLDEVFR